MLTQEPTIPICPDCGTRLEGGFSRNLGRCMICLLRVGFDDAEDLTKPRFLPYRIDSVTTGSSGAMMEWLGNWGAVQWASRIERLTRHSNAVALKLIDSEWVKRGAEARERSCAKHERPHPCGIQTLRPFTTSGSAKRTGNAFARWNSWKAKRWDAAFAEPGRSMHSPQ